MSIKSFYDQNYAKLLSYGAGEGLTPNYYARDFIAGITPAVSGDLEYIRVMVALDGSTNANRFTTYAPNLTLNVFNTPTYRQALLGSKTVSSETIALNTTNYPLLAQSWSGTQYQFLMWLRFDFNSNIYLTAGENYWIQIEKQSGYSIMPNIYVLNDWPNPVYTNNSYVDSGKYNSKIEVYIKR